MRPCLPRAGSRHLTASLSAWNSAVTGRRGLPPSLSFRVSVDYVRCEYIYSRFHGYHESYYEHRRPEVSGHFLIVSANKAVPISSVSNFPPGYLVFSPPFRGRGGGRRLKIRSNKSVNCFWYSGWDETLHEKCENRIPNFLRVTSRLRENRSRERRHSRKLCPFSIFNKKKNTRHKAMHNQITGNEMFGRV